MEVILLTNKVILNAKGNQNSPISLHISDTKKDILSYESLNENNDVFQILKELDKRISFSCISLSKDLLPFELQPYFDIRYKKEGERGYYYLYPKTKDAYQLFPMTTSITMKFPSAIEKEDFQKNGFAKLQAKANEMQKPVPIPYIVAAKEFIGPFDNPVSYINKYGWGNNQMLVLPKSSPPAQKYIIKLFNSKEELSIETNLCIDFNSSTEITLTNKESLKEPFDIIIKIFSLKTNPATGQRTVNFSISLNLKENMKKSYEYNLKLVEFSWLINDKRGTFIFKSADNSLILKKSKFGSKQYTSSERSKYKKDLQLIKDVIQIEELSGISFEFDLSKPKPNLNAIKLAKKLLNYENCYFYKKTHWILSKITNEQIEEMKSHKLFNAQSVLKSISILGKEINLPENRILLKGVKILDIKETNEMKEVRAVANSVVIYSMPET